MTPVITEKFHILAIIIAVAMILFLIVKIKSGKLHIRFSLLWLFVGVIILFLSIFPGIFFKISAALGFILPINALTFFSIIFLLLIVFDLTLIISKLSEQNRKNTQELALLKAAYLKKNEGD